MQTFATDSSKTAEALLASSGGLQGMAAGPALPTTSTQATSFKTVKVGWDSPTSPTKMTLTVEGRTFSLPLYMTSNTFTIGNYTYKGYAFSTDGQNLDANVAKDFAVLYNGQYSSIGAFLRSAKAVSQTSIPNTGFVFFTTGGVTPTSQLPTQMFTYGGRWALLTYEGMTEGTFSANVDFNAKSINYTTLDLNSAQVGGGTATISGNQFSGNVNLSSGPITGTGEIAGEFYGPNAEEMGGVVNGTGTVNGVPNQPIGGIFAGNR